jgi:hypothetical protein
MPNRNRTALSEEILEQRNLPGVPGGESPCLNLRGVAGGHEETCDVKRRY